MWDGLFMLLFLSIVMGAASFLAGSLPLSFSLSARQLRLMTALGTGVLVGTSLIVIIPEGVETLYSARGGAGGHDKRTSFSLDARDSMPFAEVLPVALGCPADRRSTNFVANIRDDPDTSLMTGPDDGHDELLGDDSSATGDPSSEPHSGAEPHVWIGVSVIFGFILMYLIDTLPQTAATTARPQRFHVNLGNLSFNNAASDPHENEAGESAADSFATGNAASRGDSSRATSTTVGLVIHAAADGIALGASSTTASSRLGFIIFLALVIHKAPAAFGLASVLLKQGLSKRMARAHLIVFSLAAPVGALLTWSAIHLLGFSSSSLGESRGTEFATGVLLLFSGGTFLYVAMHTMQETGSGDHAHGTEGHGMNGYAGVPMDDPYASAHAPSPPPKQGRALVDTLVTVGGMLLPLLTQWGHIH